MKIILINGKAEYVLPYIPPIINLTVTSPPYDDMDKNYNPIQKNGLRDYKGYSWDFKAIAQGLFKVTTEGGVVVWVVGDPTIYGNESLASSLQKIYFKKTGFNIHDTMIWIKNQLSFPDNNKYYNAFEYMFILSKGKPKTFNPIKDKINVGEGRKWSGTHRKKTGETINVKNDNYIRQKYGVRWNYWLIYNQSRGIHSEHPATFPEKLAHDHIITWSNENDWILDPMTGSGTVMKKCIELNRNCIGVEISEEYCNLIKKRLNWNSSINPDIEFIYLTEQDLLNEPSIMTKEHKV